MFLDFNAGRKDGAGARVQPAHVLWKGGRIFVPDRRYQNESINHLIGLPIKTVWQIRILASFLGSIALIPS
jgi:hypothetical protein